MANQSTILNMLKGLDETPSTTAFPEIKGSVRASDAPPPSAAGAPYPNSNIFAGAPFPKSNVFAGSPENRALATDAPVKYLDPGTGLPADGSAPDSPPVAPVSAPQGDTILDGGSEIPTVAQILAYAQSQAMTPSETLDLIARIHPDKVTSSMQTVQSQQEMPVQEDQPGFWKKLGSSMIQNEKKFASGISSAIGSIAGLDDAQQDAIVTMSETANKLIAMAMKHPADSPRRKQLMEAARQTLEAAGLSADEVLAQIPTNKEVIGGAIGTAADIIGAGQLPGVTAPGATTAVSGAWQGLKTGAKLGAGFGAVQGFARGLEDNLSVKESAGRGAIGGVVGGVVGGGIGAVTGGISGFLRGRAQRSAEIDEILSRGKEGPGGALDPDVPAGSERAWKEILKRNPAAKEAIKQGLSVRDTRFLATLSPEDQAAAGKMFRIAETMKVDPNYTGRPQDVAGQGVLQKVKGLLGQRQEIGRQIGSVLDDSAGTRSVAGVRRAILAELKDAGVKVTKEGLDFTGSAFEASGADQRAIEKALALIPTESVTDKQLWIARQALDNIAEVGSPQNQFSSNADRIIGEARSGLQDLLLRNENYASLSPQYSTLSKVLQKWGGVMGKEFSLYSPMDDLAQMRAGEVGMRVLSNAAARPLALVNEIDDLALQYGIRGGNSYSQFQAAQFMDDLFNLTQPRSLQGQAARAGAAVADAADFASDIANKNVGGLVTRGLRAIHGVSEEAMRAAVKKLLRIP